tara:strand:- start:2340 stop:3074 length:735 start_codon:yes stop_codon:yes gene_type:complete
MTTNKKEIKINPALFNLSSSKKKNKTQKAKPINIKPMSIKRDLIKRIRERKNLANSNDESFKSSVDLFKEINEKKQEKDDLFSKPKIELKTNENIETFNSKLLPDPPYSNIKNGDKPTYREWKNTTQKRPLPLVLTEPMKERKITGKGGGKKLSKHYTKLGKKNKTISVLIKDRATRKTIDQEVNLLKKHEISKIKEYLRDRGLIKIGSHAPESVLRETYENAFLTGDVINTSKENLIHNYMNS